MKYNFCGNSGLQLPEISLGLWHNFGDYDDFGTARQMIHYAFENGITHFDLANNYGPPPGSAEICFGKILTDGLKSCRDELIISSKAGHLMWDGPYGDGGSRKYLMASINQSLKRTGLEYFDIFYSHRYDPQTPIAETMQALIDIVRQGKALYIGISKYPVDKALEAYQILSSQHVPCLIYQDKYSLLNRAPEITHFTVNQKSGVGFIAFSPLAQGLLTDKYLHGIPSKSRAAKDTGFLRTEDITPQLVEKLIALNDFARQRGQSLAEMALAWILRNEQVCSVIVGASSVNQLQQNLKATENSTFSVEELNLIESILSF